MTIASDSRRIQIVMPQKLLESVDAAASGAGTDRSHWSAAALEAALNLPPAPAAKRRRRPKKVTPRLGLHPSDDRFSAADTGGKRNAW